MPNDCAMNETPIYRFMQPGEEHAVSDLVTRVFNQLVAPTFVRRGVLSFLSYAKPRSLAARSRADYVVRIAQVQHRIVGMIEIHAYRHISLLFVERQFQGRGISKALLQQTLDLCRRQHPDLTGITVNASPYAVAIYERLGFRPQGPEMTRHGVRSTPMMCPLTHDV